jgi:hypothetical protein
MAILIGLNRRRKLKSIFSTFFITTTEDWTISASFTNWDTYVVYFHCVFLGSYEVTFTYQKEIIPPRFRWGSCKAWPPLELRSPSIALFVWIIIHQPAVLFSLYKSALAISQTNSPHTSSVVTCSCRGWISWCISLPRGEHLALSRCPRNELKSKSACAVRALQLQLTTLFSALCVQLRQQTS